MKTLTKYNHISKHFNPFPGLDLFDPFTFSFTPSIDESVKDKPFEYILEYSIPGIKKRNLKTRIENNHLVIEGKERKSSKKFFGKEKTISESSFYRTFLLSEDMDTNRIKAKLTKGVLKITIPKKKEFINYREIPVSGNDSIEEARIADSKNGLISGFKKIINSLLKKAA